MDEEEKPLYYGIILACIIGIIITAVVLVQTEPPEEEFSELYFLFERIDLVDGKGTFQGRSIEVSTTVWIDINNNGTQEQEEIFWPGDTFVLGTDFWNISDVAEDSTQILFGKFPKQISTSNVNFSFVIVNHLKEDHLYQYTIDYNDTSVHTQSVLVKRGEKEVLSPSFAISREGDFKVRIVLDTGEEIYFYLQVRE